ncbi:MAG: DEAD/DEAH box helicase [Candidatus Methanomethylophilaceae archaeon]|nr:DEAD/DEAH box helicase [Candidatus Methanomethylophilaceae archaeon]
MRTDELDILPKLAEALIKEGFVELHPPQAEALPIALSGKNIVAAIPTASGKSLIGFIPAMNMILTKGKKVLYIVPLKALASEKSDDLKKFSYLGFKIMMSAGDGDLDSDGGNLADADIIVATSEKADSLIRHGSRWIENVGLVIADEIHMIHDPKRGPTLEITLTKMMRRNKDLQIIALSATISNAQDLAQWLNAELISSTWRPIPLKEGVYYNEEITFDNGTSRDVEVGSDIIWSLIKQTIEEGGQCLVFVNMRKSTESLAVKYSDKMKKVSGGMDLNEREVKALEGDLESTALGKKLAACVQCGMAFHNAGLIYKQRHFVEENFRNGHIKCIVATPTLAAGINLPARRVIVRDTHRFESNAGNVPISVMEVKQMCGRAGRPGYDPYGEAVLIGKNYEDYEHLMDDYVMHDTERLTSKLGNENTLRSHILSLIATGDADSEDKIADFIKDTFFGNTSQLYGIESVIENVVDFLIKEEMVQRDGEFLRILPFGKRISDLYIDPKSAMILRDAIKKIDDDTDDFLILHAVTSTPDVPGLYPKKLDDERLRKLADDYDGKFLIDIYNDEDEMIYDYFMSDLKTAALVSDWVNERSEEDITESMGIGPGDIRSRVDMTDWLLYSMNEIAFIIKPEATKSIRPLLTRVRYGVKEELVDLVSFRGVGRARARVLFNYGLKTKNDISAADFEELSKLPKIGIALAKSMMAQCGRGTMKIETPAPEIEREEEEMLDKMAEEYEEKENKKDPQTAPIEKKQSKISDF